METHFKALINIYYSLESVLDECYKCIIICKRKLKKLHLNYMITVQKLLHLNRLL